MSKVGDLWLRNILHNRYEAKRLRVSGVRAAAACAACYARITETKKMSVYLGNLSVEEIEKRSGVEFPEDLKEYMGPRRQQSASNIKQGAWHCFDIPFVLVCGDMETATEIHSYLKVLSSKFKEPLQISISSA